jgi:hypothetical protein
VSAAQSARELKYDDEGVEQESEREYAPPASMVRYRHFKTPCAYVCGEFLRFYLTTGFDRISYTYPHITECPPNYSCRLASEEGAALLLPLDDWVDGMDEAWIRELESGPGGQGVAEP